MDLFRTVSEIDGDFGRKCKISPPRVFCADAEGVSLEIGYRRWESKNWYGGATGPRKKFDDVFSRHWYNPATWWTDWHRATEKTALTHSVAQ